MTDLEKIIDPNTENSIENNPETSSPNENIETNIPHQNLESGPENMDSTEINESNPFQESTENLASEEVNFEPSQPETIEAPQDVDKTIEEPTSIENNSPENESINEAPNFNETTENTEWNNDNSILLWRFENSMINTTENESTPVETETSQWINEEEKEKNKLVQKEKLAQLIKTYETKAQKSWFTKWIICGVAITLWIILLSVIFAKNQIVNILDSSKWNNEIVIENDENLDDELAENDDEEITNENEEDINNEESIDDKYEQIKSFLWSWYDKDTAISHLKNMLEEENKKKAELEELIAYISQTIVNITTSQPIESNLEEIENDEIEDIDNTEESDNTEEPTNNEELQNNETINEESPTEDTLTEDIPNKENDTKGYTITRVNFEPEANWVLPSHCDNLDCYGEDKEFTPCTEFRLFENMDENANRIGNNWVCRYKDVSELVYVEFK